MNPKHLNFILIITSVLAVLPTIWVLVNGSTSTNLQSSIAFLITETLFVVMFLLNGAKSLENGNKKLGLFLFCGAVFLVVVIILSFFKISARIDLMLQ